MMLRVDGVYERHMAGRQCLLRHVAVVQMRAVSVGLAWCSQWSIMHEGTMWMAGHAWWVLTWGLEEGLFTCVHMHVHDWVYDCARGGAFNWAEMCIARCKRGIIYGDSSDAWTTEWDVWSWSVIWGWTPWCSNIKISYHHEEVLLWWNNSMVKYRCDEVPLWWSTIMRKYRYGELTSWWSTVVMKYHYGEVTWGSTIMVK